LSWFRQLGERIQLLAGIQRGADCILDVDDIDGSGNVAGDATATVVLSTRSAKSNSQSA